MYISLIRIGSATYSCNMGLYMPSVLGPVALELLAYISGKALMPMLQLSPNGT